MQSTSPPLRSKRRNTASSKPSQLGWKPTKWRRPPEISVSGKPIPCRSAARRGDWEAPPTWGAAGTDQAEGGPMSDKVTLGQRIHKFLVPVPKLKPPISPALLHREEQRAESAQNRVADRITTFSGSMLFVYIHIVWFGCWIGFGVEAYPF